MTTRSVIERYFRGLSAGEDWQASFADGMTFSSHAGPGKQVNGRDAFVESTQGFYSMIERVDVRELLVDGNRAAAIARYVLRHPKRGSFTCDVAELFTVDDDAIHAFEIFFDSAPFAA